MRSSIRMFAAPLALLAACALAPGAGADIVEPTLYGITGSGAPSELRVIDRLTGTSEVFMSLGLEAVGAATVARNTDGTALYVAGTVSAVPTLKTIAPFLPTIQTATLDRPFANLAVRSDGTLIGLSRNGGAWELCSIAPGSGVSTVIGTLTGLATIAPAARTMTNTGRLVQLGFNVAEPGVLRLFVINATTGAVESSEVSDAGYSGLAFRLGVLGTSWNGANEDLRSVNPATGISSLVTAFPAFGVLPPVALAVDDASARLYQVGHAASAADDAHLYGVGTGGVGAPTDVTLDERYVALVHAPLGPILAADPSAPHVLSFGRAFPNPSQGMTRFAFSLDRARRVEIRIADVTGRVVRTLAEGTMAAGAHMVEWQGRDDVGRRVPAGVYFARMRTEGREHSQRIVMIQ